MRTGIRFDLAGVRKSYDRGLVRALERVDLSIGAGERTAIVGSTGAGKSTLLAILALIDEPDAGDLRIDGLTADCHRPSEDWRAANVGIVFQLHHLMPHLTALENVALPLLDRLGKREAIRRASATLDEIGLAHRAGARAATLSGGERQLVAVARALVVEPRLVLADEPTGSVDSATGARVLQLLMGWSDRSGATLIVATHDSAIAAACERIVRLRDGVVGSIVPHGRGEANVLSRVAQSFPAAAS